MTDLPEVIYQLRLDNHLCTSRTEYTSGDINKAISIGIAQGRREQAEKCKEARKRLDTILNPPPGKHEIARMNMGCATGEQDG